MSGALQIIIVGAALVLHLVSRHFISSLPEETSSQDRFAVGMSFGVGSFWILAGILVAAANGGAVRLVGILLLGFGIGLVRHAVVRRRALRQISAVAYTDQGQ